MPRLRHTDYRLWALFTLVALAAFGLYHPDYSPEEGLWGFARAFVVGKDLRSAIGVTMWLFVLSPPALLAGWVAQAAALAWRGWAVAGPEAADYDDAPLDRPPASPGGRP